MLGAVMSGHRHMQPVIQAIIQLAEKAAKEPRDFAQPDTKAVEKGNARHRRKGPAQGLCDPGQARAPGRRRRGEEGRDGRTSSRTARTTPSGPMLLVAGVFKELEAKIVR